MRINKRDFELAIAKSGKRTREITSIGKVSANVISRVRRDPEYMPNLVTIGKIARGLGVEVEYLVEV